MAIPEPQLKFVNGADGACEVSYIAADNTVAIKLALSGKQTMELFRELDAYPSLYLDGAVHVSINSDVQEPSTCKTYFVDQLVADAISKEMLEDEPEAAHLLAEFRTRLLKSLEHVDTAIASLPKT